MGRKTVLFICVVGVIALGVMTGNVDAQSDEAMKQAQANEPVVINGALTRPFSAASSTTRTTPDGPGTTIIYDDGIVTAAPSVSSFMYGNQFNTFSGGTVASHSVTRMSFYIVAGATGGDVFVSLYGPVAGTAAPFYEDLLVSLNNGTGAFNTATFGPYAGGGSFQAGVWYVAGDTVGLGSGTTAGQGHHGMMINDIVGTGFASLPSLNALVGATTVVVPVELMEFSVEN